MRHILTSEEGHFPIMKLNEEEPKKLVCLWQEVVKKDDEIIPTYRKIKTQHLKVHMVSIK